MDSVDELHEALSTSRGLRYSCGFTGGAPSRSQMSRDINSMDLGFVITVFNEIRHVARKLGVYKRTEYSDVIDELKELSDHLLISIDATLLVLNKGLFPFLKKGFCTLTGKQEYGIRVNVGHCINANSTTALSITNADSHETNEFEKLVIQTIQICRTTNHILQIFRHLLGGEYTEMSMSMFIRAIQYSDDLEMILCKPPPFMQTGQREESIF